MIHLNLQNPPAWLVHLREDMESITTRAALDIWQGPTPDNPPYYNYRLEHVRQVERDALRLLAAEGGDAEIVLAGVWLHDRYQPQYHGGLEHGPNAAVWAAEHLAELGFPEEKIPAVVYAVEHHSKPAGFFLPEQHEACLLWDADKLSKVGAISIMVFFAGMPAFPQWTNTPASICEHGLKRMEDKRQLAEQFYTATARKLAAGRYKNYESFYTGLYEEITFDDTCVFKD